MKWWLSDFFFGLALVFAVVGWALALSVGPVPTFMAWAFAAIGLGIAPTGRRALTLIGIVQLPFYYVGIVILLGALAHDITVSLQARRHSTTGV